MPAKLIIYYAPDAVSDSFESLLRGEEICLREITPSNIEDIRSFEDLKIFLVSNEFVHSLNKEVSGLIFCADYSNAVIFIDNGNGQLINKLYESENVFLCLSGPIKDNELMKAIKSGFR